MNEPTFTNYETGDTLKNGALIIDVDNVRGLILAMKKLGKLKFVI